MTELNKRLVKDNEYDYENGLHWKDDGNSVSDPSMNDYLAGYNENQYEFKQWAKKNKKTAAIETTPMHFYPEFLADYILTLWNGCDGNLQDFFAGFTLRYNNKLKQDIAAQILSKGYEVYPVLTDDKPRYAKLKNTMKKIATADFKTKIEFSRIILSKSQALRLCIGELDDIKEMGGNINEKDVNSLLNYYSLIFPKDYAIGLVKDLVTDNNSDKVTVDHYQDFNLSNESLKSMENMMSGNADPFYDVHDGGGDGGWDYVTDMRGLDGTAPNQYEVNAKKKDVK